MRRELLATRCRSYARTFPERTLLRRARGCDPRHRRRFGAAFSEKLDPLRARGSRLNQSAGSPSSSFLASHADCPACLEGAARLRRVRRHLPTSCRTKLWKIDFTRTLQGTTLSSLGSHRLPLQDWGCKVLEVVFIPRSAASFYNYAVGPWVSVAGRETALARGNPAKRRNFDLRFSNFDCSAVSVFNRQSKIDIRKYKMPIRYGRFEMPKTLSKDESTATDTYAKFTAEPFEAGYGHTVGNSLRRV